MKEEHQLIIDLIKQYLTENPSQRFGQALTNLKIIGFADEKQPEKLQYLLRDIYNDTDADILVRMKNRTV
jgi:hypothetical protein